MASIERVHALFLALQTTYQLTYLYWRFSKPRQIKCYSGDSDKERGQSETSLSCQNRCLIFTFSTRDDINSPGGAL